MNKKFFKYLSISAIGLHLVSGVVVGVLIGYYLDKFFNTSPILTILFFFFGIIAGFRNMYKDVQKYILNNEDNNGKDKK
ncbi:MAG: hypothetical protein DSY66_04530 [Persephonella sp.]|nr:MAG: hypothetical protein DSY53_02265 [Persephonella sp.]RUM60336.1 MAG: hypothetical protein DSY66_04530 [Persephonella sp.]